MAIVCAALAILLFVSACNSRGPLRVWLLTWSAINLGVAAHMELTHYDYRYALMQFDGQDFSPRR